MEMTPCWLCTPPDAPVAQVGENFSRGLSYAPVSFIVMVACFQFRPLAGAEASSVWYDGYEWTTKGKAAVSKYGFDMGRTPRVSRQLSWTRLSGFSLLTVEPNHTVVRALSPPCFSQHPFYVDSSLLMGYHGYYGELRHRCCAGSAADQGPCHTRGPPNKSSKLLPGQLPPHSLPTMVRS